MISANPSGFEVFPCSVYKRGTWTIIFRTTIENSLSLNVLKYHSTSYSLQSKIGDILGIDTFPKNITVATNFFDNIFFRHSKLHYYKTTLQFGTQHLKSNFQSEFGMVDSRHSKTITNNYEWSE